MTKRHFEAFARYLAINLEEAKVYGEPGELDEVRPQVAFAARVFANVASEHNPRFDRARFYRACGLTD